MISNDLNNYTSVLARFDEVILTKASKEDVKSIQKLMNNIVLQNAMDPIITEVYSRIKIIEEAQSLQLKTLEDTKKEVSSFSVLTSFQKAQAKDHAKLLDSMKGINESLKTKADKADIYSLFDIMGYREDIINLSNLIEKVKDCFSQALVLQHEAMKTFLLSGDSAVSKNRHRAEITKNLEFLMKRISLKSESMIVATKSKKHLSSVASISLENTFDMDKKLTSRNNSTKGKRIFSAVPHKRSSLVL